MMHSLQPSSVHVNGSTVRVFRNGESARATVFLHGAIPGVAAYCSGAHIWGDVLRKFAQDGAIVVLDATAPEDGGTAPVFETLDALTAHTLATLRALKLSQCHLVAHDTAGLSALLLACEAPELVSAVTVVSSLAAAPTGDGVENLTLAYPPLPRGSRQAQRWALERLSYSHHHIDDALLDACAEIAQSPAWRDAAPSRQWTGSMARSKARLFEIGRDPGVPVPVQVIWGTHDPLSTIDQGLWLYRLLAQRQPRTHFHVLNRTGSLPFREDPEAFHQVVAAFNDAVFRDGGPA